jgi:hypothetical protein
MTLDVSTMILNYSPTAASSCSRRSNPQHS